MPPDDPFFDPTSQTELEVDPQTLAECMEACAAAELACIACADSCLEEQDIAPLRRVSRLALDCADVCGATGRLLARRIDVEPRLVRVEVHAAARACSACGDESRKFEELDYCRLCAIACRHCAERCGALLRELPDTHGQTHPPGPARRDVQETAWHVPLGREH